MRMTVLQHVPFEGPAGIADWAERRGHRLSTLALYDGDPLPEPSEYDWLIAMGGPMSVGDQSQYPWLAREKAAIRAAIDAGRTVVGVCLGAQLIAQVLGARVFPNAHKEIGWMPITLTEQGRTSDLFGFLPASFEVFHWHGETFELPAGAIPLASSAACANQAFLYADRVLGLQFHVESTQQSVAAIVRECAQELTSAPYIQTAQRMLSASPEDYAALQRVLVGILERLPP